MRQEDERDPAVNMGPYIRKSLAMQIDGASRPQELFVYHEWSPAIGQTYVPETEVEEFVSGNGPYSGQEAFFRQDFNESGSTVT